MVKRPPLSLQRLQHGIAKSLIHCCALVAMRCSPCSPDGRSQLENSFAGRARSVSGSSKTGPDKALPRLLGAPGRLLGRAQCVVRQARPAAFIKTISDILCFPFRPLFPPAVLAWCPMGRGEEGPKHPPPPPPTPAMSGGASGGAVENREQWADKLCP